MSDVVSHDDVRSITSGGTTFYTANHERLLTELESSEGQLGAIIRSLYDDNEEESFLKSLETRIKQHDREIERMCNKNYQGFIESVTHLVKVKSEAHKLKNKVMEVDKVVQDSGKDHLEQLKKLQNLRAIQNNILATIETLTLCIPVLEMYSKLLDLMKEKRFYSALKTLEQLEHIYLPRVRGYIFSEELAKEIPNMRLSIENQSKSELKEYLTEVRKVSVHIGEVAMFDAQRTAHLSLSSDLMEPLDKTKEVDLETCAQDLVDFSPVYRCLHIHSVLSKQEQFVEEYRSHRRQQLRLAIKPPTKADKIKEFKEYFYNIVGFFVVEDTIMHTCQNIGMGHKADGEGLISQSILDEYWEMATSEMLSVLRAHCLHCDNNHLLLKIKWLIVWFCHTLMGYGFKGEKLYEVALEIRERYDELMMKSYAEAFNNLLSSDDYTPVVVDSEPQFQGMLEIFPIRDITIMRAPFPRTLPFSSMVPQIFKQLKSYIADCKEYSDRLNLSHTEIDEGVRKSVNLLLTKSLSGCLASLIEKGHLTIQQLTQLWVNLNQLEESEEDLDTFIALVTSVPKSDIASMQSRLYGFSTFKDAKLTCQNRIALQVEHQVVELMEGLRYDWTPKEVPHNPSSCIEDVIRFLNSHFQIFTTLPTKVIDHLCIHSIQQWIECHERILLSDSYSRLSIEGLKTFAVDVKRCEEFVTTVGNFVPSLRATPSVGGAHSGLAESLFARLNQLLMMFFESGWSDYISELTNVGAKKYPAVPPEAVMNLLTKILDNERKKKKKFHHTTAASKEKLKYYELILKRIEGLIEDGTFVQNETSLDREMRFHDKKRKKKKLKTLKKKKKEPNPVKEALKAIQEHLQEKQNPSFAVGSRLSIGTGANSSGRMSPILFQRGSFKTPPSLSRTSTNTSAANSSGSTENEAAI